MLLGTRDSYWYWREREREGFWPSSFFARSRVIGDSRNLIGWSDLSLKLAVIGWLTLASETVWKGKEIRMAGLGWEKLSTPRTKQLRMRLFGTNGKPITELVTVTVAFKNTFIFHKINIFMKKMNGILNKKWLLNANFYKISKLTRWHENTIWSNFSCSLWPTSFQRFWIIEYEMGWF